MDNIYNDSNNQIDNSFVPIESIIQNTSNNVQVKKKKDKILIIQLILLLAWIIVTVLVYYFGYDLFKPFINVE